MKIITEDCFKTIVKHEDKVIRFLQKLKKTKLFMIFCTSNFTFLVPALGYYMVYLKSYFKFIYHTHIFKLIVHREITKL